MHWYIFHTGNAHCIAIHSSVLRLWNQSNILSKARLESLCSAKVETVETSKEEDDHQALINRAKGIYS